MCLLAELHNFAEVLMVDMRVHSEQPLQYCLGDGQEIFWERNA